MSNFKEEEVKFLQIRMVELFAILQEKLRTGGPYKYTEEEHKVAF